MLLIHIGFRKTGSSTIQHFLGLNAGRLARSGVDYPDAGRIGWAHNGLREELQADGDLSQWRAVRDLAAARPDRVTVVSCEGFDLLQAAQVARLAVPLAGLEVRILAYIRDPAGWAVSFYGQQTLKAGNVLDFDALFERLKGHGRLRAGERLAPWAEVFGWDALRVRSLDPRSLAGGDLLDDLLDAVGLPGADPDHAFAGREPRKISRGWKPLEAMRALNGLAAADGLGPGHGRATRQVRMACLDILEELGLDAERTAYASLAQRRLCRSLHAEEIAALNRRLAPALPLPADEEEEERPFLPSISHVPRAERLALAEGLSAWAREADAIDRRRADALADCLRNPSA